MKVHAHRAIKTTCVPQCIQGNSLIQYECVCEFTRSAPWKARESAVGFGYSLVKHTIFTLENIVHACLPVNRLT